MVNLKEYRGLSGIYKITCIINAKVYIGSAVDIGKRWNNHLSDLGLGRHRSSYLQNTWNKYGAEAFNFTVLEYVENKNDLVVREQYWLDFYKSYNREYGFNICSTASSSLGIKRSEEFKNKLKNRKRTEEWNLRISQSKTGVKQSIEHRINAALKRSLNWIVTSPEGKQFEVHNLTKFCVENKLDPSSMIKVAKGKWKHHRGWKCKYG